MVYIPAKRDVLFLDYTVSVTNSGYLVQIQDITEHKKAEEALHESEKVYREFFDNPLNGFALCEIITDEKGEPVDFVYLKLNKAFENFTGLKREEVLNKRVTDVLPYEEVADVIQIYGKVALTGKATAFQYPIPSLSRYYEVAAFSPRKKQFIAFFTDITDRKKAEEALQKSEEKLRTLFESIPLGISILDKDRNIIYDNPALEKILGLKKEDLLQGKYAKRKYIRSDLTEIPFNNIPSVKALNEQEPVKDVEIGVKEDNSIIWTNVSAIPLSFSDWKVLVVTYDITKRKEAEKEIDMRNVLLDGINNVFQESLIGETEEEVAVTCLNVANRITKSEFGFIGLINENGNMDTIAIDKTGWEKCNATLEEALRLTRDMKVQSYWGRVIKEGKSQIVNNTLSDPDRMGIPEGHPLVNLFLGVPFKQSGKTIGLICLANKDGGYTEEDKNNIETLSVAFVEALMRKKAEIELKETLDNLELKVRERTLELKKSEYEIKRKNRILDGINAIFRAAIINPSEEEFGKTCLDVCEELTGSKFSFIGGINKKGRFDSIAVSERGWQACNMVKEQGSESVNDNVIQGIRSRAIDEKRDLDF